MEFLSDVLFLPFFSTLKASMEILRQYAAVSWVLSGIADLEFLWKEWNVETFVLASFSFQVLLVFITPFRKRSSNVILSVSIWISYLLADWVAILAVSFIYKELENPCEQGSEGQRELFAFWAQFVLVHLGGPDTITALALEDNELWLRTGLHLGTQAYSALGVLVKSVKESSLWAPTILMFFVGLIKYLERVFSLFHGRLGKSEEQLDHYVKLLSEHVPKDSNNSIPPKPEASPSAPSTSTSGAAEETTQVSLCVRSRSVMSNVEMVRDALYFFLQFKAYLYADQQFKPDEQKSSRNYFLHRTPEEGFRVLEIELNFSYDAFYTKMIVIHKTFWTILRYVVIACEALCLVIWCFSAKKKFNDYNIGITYTLLIGAIAMDVFGLLRIQVSYWNIASLKEDSRIRSWIYGRMLSAWEHSWVPRAFSRRWSESVPQLNLINFCVDKQPLLMQKMIQRFGIKYMLNRYTYVTRNVFSTHLRDFIFDYLKESSSLMSRGDHFVDYICYAKGNWAFLRMRLKLSSLATVNSFLRDYEYDDVLIAWHIITEIYYQQEYAPVQNDQVKDKYRKISKTLSDYMMYLFVHHPEIMSTVTVKSRKNIQEACNVLKTAVGLQLIEGTKDAQHREACNKLKIWLFASDRKWQPTTTIVETSLLSRLMRDLWCLYYDNIEKWEVVANVWLEILCYTAIRCRPNFHAVHLKQGGELISFVWLLMTQFGFRLSDASESKAAKLGKRILENNSVRDKFLPANATSARRKKIKYGN